MEKLIQRISKVVEDIFESCGYDRTYGTVNLSNRPDLCQFQCNGALPAAKVYKKSPIEIAQSVLPKLQSTQAFKAVTTAGPGFINITLNDDYLIGYLDEMKRAPKYGCLLENPQTIMVDYGGANVAKPLHVGHLRSAIIGESLKRMGRFLGHEVIGDVHLGDWGLQMGMVISEVQRRQPTLPYFDASFEGPYPEEAPFTIDELEEIYPAASQLAKTDPLAMEAARKATFELQKGRAGYMALWQHIINVSVADLRSNYENLNVTFDLWNGESDSQKYIDPVVKYLKDHNYTLESEGALVVDVAKEEDTYTVPPFIVLKSDGASLYSTTDLATIWERVQDYHPHQIIYVVDKRQGLHFEQVFRCAKKTNIASPELQLDFVGFGTMNGKDGKPFKTREGGVMRLQDLIEIIKSHVRNKLKDNTAFSPEEMEEIARKVGLSALKYGDLSNQVTKDYVFDIERFSSFEGNTGPYILYTVVRIKSILRKAEESESVEAASILAPKSQTERDLMLKISKFNEVVAFSFNEKAPNKLCEYVYELANLFNKFYHETKILTEENQAQKKSWISLITLAKDILECTLDLLGIETPERM